MPVPADRKSTLEARLTLIQSAINGTLSRNAMSYSINGRAIASMSLKELRDIERETLNEIAALDRVIAGRTRFGGIGFKAVTS